jgi:flagellar basal body rod protein FlgF
VQIKLYNAMGGASGMIEAFDVIENALINVVTLALGSQPRQGLAKVRAKSEPGSHISCS